VNELRWILKIGVDHHNDISGHGVKTRSHGSLVTEVPREMKRLEPLIGFTDCVDHRGRSIPASIVYENDLERLKRWRKNLKKPRMKRFDDRLFVVNRHDHRQKRTRRIYSLFTGRRWLGHRGER
jgi:hypothetical protein